VTLAAHALVCRGPRLGAALASIGDSSDAAKAVAFPLAPVAGNHACGMKAIHTALLILPVEYC